uniref:Armadillo repeat-containing domain-containing protein n=1 Tax=Dendroctonus ponderosae TaxID=77166 RepID=A0AAR5PEL7_DENPD
MGLLKLISHQQQIKWHPRQECYLVSLSLNILLKIVPASTEEFIEDGGPSTVLQLLSNSRDKVYHYSHDIMLRSIELLALLSHKFTTIRDSVAFNGGVNCVLGLCEDVLESHFLQEQQQHLLSAGIFLLEKVCNHINALEVLPMIIKYMNRYIEPDEKDQLQIPKVIILCLSFIWNQIACCEDNAAKFVKMGGVYLILDVVKERNLVSEYLKSYVNQQVVNF